MKAIFIDADRERIRQATAQAEANTSGEIVSVVVHQSDAYPELTLYSATLLWVLAELFCFLLPRDPLSGLTYELFTPSSPWFAWLHLSPTLFLPPLGFLLGLIIGRAGPMRRLWLSRRRAAEEVHQRAVQAFLETQAHDTSDRSGILIFVSLFEHRCEIVADLGYRGKVPATDWAAIVNRLSANVRTQGLPKALAQAIQECGEIAQKFFPQNGGPKRNLDDNPHLP